MARRGPMTEEQREAAALRAKASERRFNEALARMPDLPLDQMSEDGCINLVRAFWDDIRDELAHGNPKTRDWLTSDGFLRWAKIGAQDPDHLRTIMLEKVWGNRIFCNCAIKRKAL